MVAPYDGPRRGSRHVQALTETAYVVAAVARGACHVRASGYHVQLSELSSRVAGEGDDLVEHS